MKKILLLIYILASGYCLVAQTDSAMIVDAVNTGGHIATKIFPNQWLPFATNEVIRGIVGSITAFLVGFWYRNKRLKTKK